MAVRTAQVDVDDSAAVELTGADQGGTFGSSLTVKNQGSDSVFVGNDTVTDADGFEVASGSSFSVDLLKGERLYAVCAAAATATVHVIRTDV